MFVQIQCALCGKMFDHDLSSLSPTAECPHCGKSNPLAAPAAPKETPAAADAPSSGGPKPCPSCKVAVEPDAVICIHCGYNFASGKKVGGKNRFAANQKRVFLIGGGLGLLVLGLGYLLWPEPETPPPFDPSSFQSAAVPPAPPSSTEPAAPSQLAPPSSTNAPAMTNAPVEPAAPPSPAGPAPEELAAQKAAAEQAALEEKKFNAEQDLRIQLDTQEPLYGQNELVELRRKNGILDKGTFSGFSGAGTNRVVLVATPTGEIGIPLAALDTASRRRVDPEFREAFIQHMINTRFSSPAPEK